MELQQEDSRTRGRWQKVSEIRRNNTSCEGDHMELGSPAPTELSWGMHTVWQSGPERLAEKQTSHGEKKVRLRNSGVSLK